MGKPYQSELERLRETYTFSLAADVKLLAGAVKACFGGPLLVVASGGSLAAAELVARLHETYARQPARTLTPLELSRHPLVEGMSVMILSAGDANPDVLEAARRAVAEEYETVVGVCAAENSPVAALLRGCRHAVAYEFAPPSGEDGLLAANTLLATCALIARAYQGVSRGAFGLPASLPALEAPGDAAWPDEVLDRTEYRVLASGWAVPAALDLQSRVSEGGLGTASVTDFRNFADGRLHGLARRLERSTVVSLRDPEAAEVAERTLEALPPALARAILETPLDGPAGAIDLLVRVLRFAGAVGARAGVDPARPEVPEFGRTLYDAGFQSPASRAALEVAWLKRKVTEAGWDAVPESVRAAWRASFTAWSERIRDVRFGGVVLDYDGTICEPDERWTLPSEAVRRELARLLDHGVYIGIATGRGGHALESLRQLFSEEHWPRVLAGVFNGGVRVPLDQPWPQREVLPEIAEADALLRGSEFLSGTARLASRTVQITIEPVVPIGSGLLRRAVEEVLFQPERRVPVRLFQSGHSVDVIPVSSGKRAVVEDLRTRLAAEGRGGEEILSVGDQGRGGGNDFELLASPWGLSVERVSTSLDSCWNLARPGERRTRALLRYLAALRPADDGHIRFHIDDFLGSSSEEGTAP